jgi:hypothetical protein
MTLLRSAEFAFPYFVLWASMVRALLVKAQIAPKNCGRCGRVLERKMLGEPVCRCG